MSTTISTPRLLAATGLLVTLVTARVGNAGSAYLPITGPTPLRFEVAMVRPSKPGPAILPLKPVEKSGDTFPHPTAAAPTNAPEEIHYSAGEPPAEPPEPPMAAVGTEPAMPAVVHPLTESPQFVTPQMLAEYFRPAAGSTNGPGVSILLPVSAIFRPPTEQPQARSRATYKTE